MKFNTEFEVVNSTSSQFEKHLTNINGATYKVYIINIKNVTFLIGTNKRHEF